MFSQKEKVQKDSPKNQSPPCECGCVCTCGCWNIDKNMQDE
jgi:hypothetical protein